MEELEEIQLILSGFNKKTKKTSDIPQDNVQENWDVAKKVMVKAEDKVTEIFKT
jgi:hypothetical protein